MNKYKYIVVEGVPGSGKEHLAKYLSERRGARLILDQYKQNPFLNDFYMNKSRYALSTQMSFLTLRWQMLSEIMQQDLFDESFVTNVIFERNFIYANITLLKKELELFNELNSYFKGELPHPDLVIYLQTLPNFTNRSERNLLGETLANSLCEAYDHFFFLYNEAPVLVLRPDQLDLHDINNLEEINAFINQRIVGTVYFSKGGSLF